MLARKPSTIAHVRSCYISLPQRGRGTAAAVDEEIGVYTAFHQENQIKRRAAHNELPFMYFTESLQREASSCGRDYSDSLSRNGYRSSRG